MRNPHCHRLVDLIAEVAPNPRLGAEVGVWRGELSRALLEAFPDLTLFAVDPWDNGEPNLASVASKAKLRDAKRYFYANTNDVRERLQVLPMTSVEAMSHVSNGSLDFVFIDANHRYESAKQDMGWFDKVRDGGLFSGDDYGTRYEAPRGPDGVKRAVDEWAAANNRVVTIGKRHVWWFLK